MPALCFVTVHATARAQLPIPSLSLAGGVSRYTLSGTNGSTPIGAVRVDVPVVIAVVEGSVAILRPTENGSAHTYVIPEAQLQWQLFPTVVKPYVGLGGGWFKSVGTSSVSRSDGTVSAAAGVRVAVPMTGLGFRAEVRYRTIGGLDEHATEITLGVNW